MQADLYLQTGHISDCEAKDAPSEHGAPEPSREDFLGRGHVLHLSGDEDQREEEEGGVDVVVQGQLPDVFLHYG